MDIPRRPIFKVAVQGWSPFQTSPPRVVKTAAMTCPTCGKAFHLGDHQIDAAGLVDPSVVCPWSCGYHQFVRLLDWP